MVRRRVQRAHYCVPGGFTPRCLVTSVADVLQAELHGKVSSQALKTDDARLEDTLTSAVFGALQYLPRATVLSAVLADAFPHLTWTEAECMSCRFEFWPTFYDGTEPDLLITIGKRLVVVEAKYAAAFGVRQLEQEWRGALQVAAARGLETVLMLAVTRHLGAEPTDVREFRDGENLGPRVAHLSWQQIGLVLDDLDLVTQEANDLRCDVLAVMEKRGVRHVYTGIEEEDWWLVSAAQRAARKRVYPQIAALARELQDILEPDGIRWGTSEDKVVHYHSFSLSHPASWARSYLQLPLWPADFATQGRGRSWWATFHVLFDFLNAQVSVGYLTRPETVTQAKQAWAPAAADLIAAVSDLAEDWVLTSSHGNYASLERSKHPRTWAEAELVESLSKPGCHLVLERRLQLPQFTGGSQAREMLVETVEVIRAQPVWLPEASRLAPPPTAGSNGDAPIADDKALEATETDAAEDASAGAVEQ